MENIFLDSLIHEYKQASIAYEIASAAREAAKEKFLEFVNKKEGQYGDLTVSIVHPEASFDWKALLKEFAFQQSQLAPFYKPKPSYVRVTIKRGISV
jgi:hypothetical protein